MKKSVLLVILLAFFLSPSRAQYKITNYTDMNQINSLVEDGDYIWVCTSGGAFKRKKSDGTLVTVFNTSNSGIARNTVSTMYIDFYGNYWFGTNYGGISMFNGSEWTTIDMVDGFKINDCETITADVNGNIWFGVNNGHVLKYDGENWENIDLHGNWYAGSILGDDEGNIWIGIPGIHGSGYRIDQEGNISDFNGPGDIFLTKGVYDIGKDQVGNIWFTSYGGVYRYNVLSGSWSDFSSGFGGNNYSFAMDGEGNIWISNEAGAHKFDGTLWTHYNSGESGDRVNMVLDLLCDAQGNVWIGGYNGLARIIPGSSHWSTAIRVNALKSNYVETMSFTSGKPLLPAVATITGFKIQ
jgi:ligand-binding sensor domain-containing protein